MKDKVEISINEKLDYMMIGEKATSYSLPLYIKGIKDYDNKICIETKNITKYYIVFDKDNFIKEVLAYLARKNLIKEQ